MEAVEGTVVSFIRNQLVLLKTLSIIYPKIDKKNIIKACRCPTKQGFLGISQNSERKTCTGVSFFINVQVFNMQLYLKRNSGAGVFL